MVTHIPSTMKSFHLLIDSHSLKRLFKNLAVSHQVGVWVVP